MAGRRTVPDIIAGHFLNHMIRKVARSRRDGDPRSIWAIHLKWAHTPHLPAILRRHDCVIVPPFPGMRTDVTYVMTREDAARPGMVFIPSVPFW